jgi:hypothetical protein
MSRRERGASIAARKMALLANSVRFRQPHGNFGVDLVDILETKGVQMIPGRKSFDAAKALIFQSTRQYDVTVDPALSNDESGEAHTHLKCDSRFLGKHCDGSVRLGEAAQLVEDGSDLSALSLEMGSECVSAAGVRLIPVGKLPATIRTTPHGSAFGRGAFAHFPQR